MNERRDLITNEIAGMLNVLGIEVDGTYGTYRPDLNPELKERVIFKGDDLPPIERVAHEFYITNHSGTVLLAIKTDEETVKWANIAAYHYTRGTSLQHEYILHHSGVAVYKLSKWQ